MALAIQSPRCSVRIANHAWMSWRPPVALEPYPWWSLALPLSTRPWRLKRSSRRIQARASPARPVLMLLIHLVRARSHRCDGAPACSVLTSQRALRIERDLVEADLRDDGVESRIVANRIKPRIHAQRNELEHQL